ncbi:MAG: hypothetical protein JF888_03855 [Candidatus Dormibacteraeota bacterium]|uniref:Uncharacterized protein n=1 Tax=Candidatus Dormiibacter inghamiae TaxID=3127013 RepID=A0A934NBC5_9BACT|nr:hypothetical protein [Candidatus Dormibacteraeota bacterium]MBJ7604924.1 hypothetical protein [Candidatus Dormibacteraeota bacterium]
MGNRTEEPETDSEDDPGLVLEAIEFMLRLSNVAPEQRRDLEELRSRIQRLQSESEPFR